jgi:hypothetical protein
VRPIPHDAGSRLDEPTWSQEEVTSVSNELGVGCSGPAIPVPESAWSSIRFSYREGKTTENVPPLTTSALETSVERWAWFCEEAGGGERTKTRTSAFWSAVPSGPRTDPLTIRGELNWKSGSDASQGITVAPKQAATQVLQ